MSDLVRFEQLWKIYGTGEVGVPALRGIDLTVEEGEYVAIMGHSGSGKSTMLNLLGCLDRPSRGEYVLGGARTSEMSDDELSELRNLRIGFVFQSFNLIQGVSALENIEVPLFYRGVSRRRRRPISRELAERVGLGDRTSHRPSELSGGQQQRVAIARALANDPLILLADEPTGNLDSGTTREILALIDDLHARGRTVIVVTHEQEVADHAERTITLTDGEVSADVGSSERRRPVS